MTFCQDNKEFIRKVCLMEYHQNSDKYPAKETPLMKLRSNNWSPPSVRNVHVDSFVYAHRKQCMSFAVNNNPTQIGSINNNKKKHSLDELAKDQSVTIAEANKGVLLSSSTHLITSTVVIIFCQVQPITKMCNQKHLRSSQVKGKT